MAAPTGTSQRGCLLLADISGYTAFLARSELEHADDILRSLIRTLIENLTAPLVISRIEGDAVFAYVTEGSLFQGQTLVEVIENLYCAFAAAREQMQHNTTCTCTACTLIPELDLKLVVHHGAFVVQQLDPRHLPQPSGSDVIIAHRLLKNLIREKTGIAAYAFFTRECAEALGLGEMLAGMQPHAECYEHLGEVSGFVYDLHPVWAARREQQRFSVSREESWFTIEADYPVSPAQLWDYLTEPELKRRWRAADEMRVTGLQGGRAAPGTTHHCVHGNTVIQETIVDWRPFEHLTCECVWPMQARSRYTTAISPREEGGTHLTIRVAPPAGSGMMHSLLVRSFYAAMKKKLQGDYNRSLNNLRELIDEWRLTRRDEASQPAQTLTHNGEEG